MLDVDRGLREAAATTVHFVAVAWLALAGGLLFWANVPILWGWQPRLVLSGSMAPALQPGDVVLTSRVGDPRGLPVRRVVAVKAPYLDSGSYLHRVVRRDFAGRLITRGDANGSDDYPAVEPHRVLGQVVLAVPLVGRPVQQARSGNPLPLGLAVLGTAAATVVLGRRDPDPYLRPCSQPALDRLQRVL